MKRGCLEGWVVVGGVGCVVCGGVLCGGVLCGVWCVVVRTRCYDDVSVDTATRARTPPSGGTCAINIHVDSYKKSNS